MKSHLFPPELAEQQIQHAAYLLWEGEGMPAGRDLEIWLAAKERLKHQLPARESEHRGPVHAAVTVVKKKTAKVVG
jgi:hypothetical protein